MSRISLEVEINSVEIMKQWAKAKEKARELNLEMIKLGEVITKVCEITEEMPRE